MRKEIVVALTVLVAILSSASIFYFTYPIIERKISDIEYEKNYQKEIQTNPIHIAWLACEDYTKTKLMVPSSAKFKEEPNWNTACKEDFGCGQDDIAKIMSYVDSTNRWGVFVRTNFTCLARVHLQSRASYIINDKPLDIGVINNIVYDIMAFETNNNDAINK